MGAADSSVAAVAAAKLMAHGIHGEGEID